MLAAVIPAKNEENGISRVIATLLQLPFDLIIPVVNGSQDRTLESCILFSSPKIHTLHFMEPLGIDVPRAAGAFYACRMGAQKIIFVDGDMTGCLYHPLEKLIFALNNGVDCALTNCYPYLGHRHSLAKKVLRYREILNRKLGLFHHLGLANPSHGPHGVSGKLLEVIPLSELAVPPVELTMAVKNDLLVEVSAAIPHQMLGSKERSLFHTSMTAETIIGDCIEALSWLNGAPRHRMENGVIYDGYHPYRRFDLLDDFFRSHDNARVYRHL